MNGKYSRVLFTLGALALLFIVSLWIYRFYEKRELTFEEFVVIESYESDFRPDAYQYYHDQESLNRYFQINESTRAYRQALPMDLEFDFSNYSYLVVYGKPLKKIWYSKAASRFKDPSPSYARPKGRIVTFMEYDTTVRSNYLYFYQLPKDKRLRGFFGL